MKIILAIAVLVTSVTIANGQIIRPLPQVIQNLSNEDYAVWVGWQNRQAIRRAEEIIDDTAWNKYSFADQVVTNSFSRGNATTQLSSSSRSTSNSSIQSGEGWSNRSGSHAATRRGQSNTDFNRQGGTTTTTRQVRYRNPEYVGAGAVMTYSPWVRLKGRLGTPNWSNLFVPCKKGTLTMQEALDQIPGPLNAEKTFKALLEDYFGN